MLDKLQFINNELDRIEVRAESVMHMANVRGVLAQVMQEVMEQEKKEHEEPKAEEKKEGKK